MPGQQLSHPPHPLPLSPCQALSPVCLSVCLCVGKTPVIQTTSSTPPALSMHLRFINSSTQQSTPVLQPLTASLLYNHGSFVHSCFAELSLSLICILVFVLTVISCRNVSLPSQPALPSCPAYLPQLPCLPSPFLLPQMPVQNPRSLIKYLFIGFLCPVLPCSWVQQFAPLQQLCNRWSTLEDMKDLGNDY